MPQRGALHLPGIGPRTGGGRQRAALNSKEGSPTQAILD